MAVQTLTKEGNLTLDHRLLGVIVAAIALRFKAPFPIMMALAALTSALTYNLS